MRRLIQMDFEQSEILETTPEYFLQWLEAEAKAALKWPNAQSLEFRGVEKTTFVTLQYPRTTMNKLEIEATATVEKDGENVAYGQKWGVVIEFLTLQLNNNETQLTGGYKKYPGIKDYFDLLWKEILNVFPRRTTTDIGSAEDTLKKKFEMLKPETQDRYREMWEIMCDMDLEYQEDALDKIINNPKPQMGEYRDRIIHIMGAGTIGTSERTLQKIRKYGEAGLLN